METAGRYVAYMAVPNWATVLMLGWWFGQRERRGERSYRRYRKWPFIVGAAAALALAATGWLWVSSQVPIERTFPFMRVAAVTPGTGALFVSSTVTVLYAAATLLVFQTFHRVHAPALVTFVSRNTLLIFLLHMPLFYVMEPVVAGWTSNRALRSTIYLTLCLPGLAIVSEVVRGVVRPRELRAWVYARMPGGNLFAAPSERRHDSPISDVR
jgi:fucose 4-O-acetylase-like acetyltransferase